MSTQAGTIIVNGEEVTVPGFFAEIYGYIGEAWSDVTAVLTSYTVGELEQDIDYVIDLIHSYPWAQIKAQLEQAGAHNDPLLRPGYEVIAGFAAGDFSLIDTAFDALRDFLAQYPDTMPVLEALGDIDGLGGAIEEGYQNFQEALDGQILEGGSGASDIVGFSNGRAAYEIGFDADGNVVISGPGGGSATLLDIEKLVFTDFAYNLEIAQKATSVAPGVLDSLVDLYVAYFNRAPEAEGLGYWIDQYNAGKSLNDIAVEFFNAGVAFSELTGYTADMPLSDFISAMYANVLGRSGADAPPSEDIDYWIGQINGGVVTREGLVQRFLGDARLLSDHPEYGWVSDLLDNRVEFGKIHAIAMGIDYVDAETAYTTSQDLAGQVTAAGFGAAVQATGLSTDDYLAW